MQELLNCQNATVSNHSFDRLLLDIEMQGSGSSFGAISCLSVEKSEVAGLANHSTSIIKKVSPNICKNRFFIKSHLSFCTVLLMIERRKDWQQRQGDIRSACGRRHDGSHHRFAQKW